MRIAPIPLTQADIALIAAYYEARRRYEAMRIEKAGGRFSSPSRQSVGPMREVGLRRATLESEGGGYGPAFGAELER